MTVNNKFNSIFYLYKYIRCIFPKVYDELDFDVSLAEDIPDKVLSKLALESISLKKFHCLGGSIYSLYPVADTQKMIHFIVAYQTISDYLDNLCDRADVRDKPAFRCLHLALSDAATPDEVYNDYYKYYPYKDDGGYLKTLVKECKGVINYLPTYDLIRDKLNFLIGLYCDLQVYKHLSLDVREEKMKVWYKEYITYYPDITGWEFAAASGSTLGIFMLVAAAFAEDLTEDATNEILDAYFPWICSLHILLDYYIDFYEDIENNDLNFVSYYKDMDEAIDRIKYFYKSALYHAKTLKFRFFHNMVIEGLFAMYLSDPKAHLKSLSYGTDELINSAGFCTRGLYNICRHMRDNGSI